MFRLVHAAVSPAVVVPTMLHLAESGYGVDKGIHILLIAGGSIENVLAISGFSLTLGLTFSQGNLDVFADIGLTDVSDFDESEFSLIVFNL